MVVPKSTWRRGGGAGAAGSAYISGSLPDGAAVRSRIGSGDITDGVSAKLSRGAGDVVVHSRV